MKILFFNPATAQRRFTPFEAIKGSAFFRRPNYDAMRLLYLSRGHDFHYYDERIEDKPDCAPHMVIVNVPLNLSRYIQSTVRSMFPRSSKIICYGFYPTLFPTQMKKACDSVVIGDIANIWHVILGDAQRKKLRRYYRSTGDYQFNVDRDIESKYGFTPILSQLRTSFGCTCPEDHRDYCYENILYKTFVQWDMKEAVEEISNNKRKIIFIRDDDFLYDIDYAVQFLDKCWAYKKMWVFDAGGFLFRQHKLFPFFRDRGVRIVYLKEDWLGTNLIEKIRNREYVKEKIRQVRMIHNCRIACGCKIRLGFEGEDYTFYEELLQFLLQMKIDLIKLTTQTPIPKTATHRKYKKDHMVEQDLTLYDQWMPVVHIPGLTPQALYSNMEMLRDRFYSWDSILQRNILVTPKLGFYNTVFFYLIPNLSYRNNFLEKVGYPP
jgi:hypothetical protein